MLISRHSPLSHNSEMFTTTSLCSLTKNSFPHYFFLLFSSVQLLSLVQLFATPWIAARQASLIGIHISSLQFSSVAQLCQTLCNPMDCSMPGPPVQHTSKLLEFTQTHVHWVGDEIQPSHPLSFPSPPTFNLSQHQGLFKWVSSKHQVVKVLEFQLQHQSFQWIFRTDFL